MSDLLFELPPKTDGNLLFGETASPVVPHYDATLNATLPALTLVAYAIPAAPVTVAVTFPSLVFDASAIYDSKTQRPTVSASLTDWQKATGAENGVAHQLQAATPQQITSASAWGNSDKLSEQVTSIAPDSLVPYRGQWEAHHTEAVHVDAGQRAIHQDASRQRLSHRSRHSEAQRVTARQHGVWHQDALRDRRAARLSRFSGADKSHKTFGWGTHSADLLPTYWDGRYQDAQKPPAGTSGGGTVEPPGETCYTPNPHLLFAKLANGSANLLFLCDNYVEPPHGNVVVPVRSVYMVINDVSLRRVDGNIYIPTLGVSLSIDYGSWTWGFNAQIPADRMSDIEPGLFGDPVELEVMVNGTAYRVLAESIVRERSFAQGSISVAGRGKSAFLDNPYAPVLTFNNTIDRTAQQLMNDALTLNGVPVGWTVDWQISDWLVPAGVWSHQGSYISALKMIAEAAGAYLQPHPTAQTMRVLPTYASAPWSWDTVTPDFTLPGALTTREGIEWVEKARYNAVYVSGEASGIRGHVVRQGTAGDVVAPMIVDPLITHADAARQRGISILADTGRQAFVTLNIPVLEETGIIEPGKFVEYVDGGETHRGIVRSTSVQVGYPEVFQLIGVETHA